MRCSYSQTGCQMYLKRTELKDHEKHCRFRTISCLIHHCNELCFVRDYIDHIKEKHRKNAPYVFFRQSKVVDYKYYGFLENWGFLREPSVKYLCLEHENRHFLITMIAQHTVQEYEQGTATVLFHTRLLTSDSEAADYRVCIKIYNKQKVSCSFE